MRVTLDTNIYVSAFQFGGVPGRILDRHTDGAFEIGISPVITAELRRVLVERFDWSEHDVEIVLGPILSRSLLVNPKPIAPVSADPDDDWILACAVESQSHVLVSGDKDLLRLREFQGISIIGARQFLDFFTQLVW